MPPTRSSVRRFMRMLEPSYICPRVLRAVKAWRRTREMPLRLGSGASCELCQFGSWPLTQLPGDACGHAHDRKLRVYTEAGGQDAAVGDEKLAAAPTTGRRDRPPSPGATFPCGRCRADAARRTRAACRECSRGRAFGICRDRSAPGPGPAKTPASRRPRTRFRPSAASAWARSRDPPPTCDRSSAAGRKPSAAVPPASSCSMPPKTPSSRDARGARGVARGDPGQGGGEHARRHEQARPA